ncbi:beta-carotene 15,15'-monooxygenase, partial [Helcococcus bovis]
MTIFYMLFYHYYEIKSGKHDKTKKLIIYILAFLRILLVLLPQNNWGTPEGNFTFNILKNIPFSIMGILLIYWTYNERNKNGLKHMSILIFFSFLFYAPVVILSKT